MMVGEGLCSGLWSEEFEMLSIWLLEFSRVELGKRGLDAGRRVN